jgi:hypothetical protein
LSNWFLSSLYQTKRTCHDNVVLRQTNFLEKNGMKRRMSLQLTQIVAKCMQGFSENYAGLLINTYRIKTKNKIKRKEKKRLRRILYLFRMDSFFKAAFICGFFDSWTIRRQDKFDFAKTQISVQYNLIRVIKIKSPCIYGAFNYSLPGLSVLPSSVPSSLNSLVR